MPELIPPGWVFGAAWTVLYVLMALAFAIVLHARGARGRGAAIIAFVAQLILNLLWSPLFFRAHQVDQALALIVVLFVLVAVTTALFWRVRSEEHTSELK